MVRTRKGLSKEAYAYWQKHFFDMKLRAELNWKEEEYIKYEEEQCKIQHAGTDTGGKQPRKKILTKQLERLVLLTLQ